MHSDKLLNQISQDIINVVIDQLLKGLATGIKAYGRQFELVSTDMFIIEVDREF